jgi:hypothetical protein
VQHRIAAVIEHDHIIDGQDILHPRCAVSIKCVVLKDNVRPCRRIVANVVVWSKVGCHITLLSSLASFVWISTILRRILDKLISDEMIWNGAVDYAWSVEARHGTEKSGCLTIFIPERCLPVSCTVVVLVDYGALDLGVGRASSSASSWHLGSTLVAIVAFRPTTLESAGWGIGLSLRHFRGCEGKC